jgi:ABC-type Fe3+-siderophore transport system permease subunit
LLINANKYIGLGPAAYPLKLTMAIIGLFLFIALLVKKKIKT